MARLNIVPASYQLSNVQAKKLTKKLLEWYDDNHRCLPWRISPPDRRFGLEPDPYHVWLSEIMLQQTTVATVMGYFSKFINRWPNIHAVSAASLEDILKMWAGLGYYSRARNLKAAADQIASLYSGNFPKDYATLRRLPGIGAYSAAAIMAIAYDKPYAAIDGNVERIIARLLAIDLPKRDSKHIIAAQMQELVPKFRAGDFAQSMMDLGATLCRPRAPHCPRCPWQSNCEAFRRGEMENFPLKQAKPLKPVRKGQAFVLQSEQGRIFLQQRQAKGLLAGMSEVPNYFGENIDHNF